MKANRREMTRKTGNEDLTKGIDYSGAVKQALLDSCQECPVFPVLLHQVCRHSANSDDPASVAADASARLCLYTTSASFALYLSFSLTPISLSLGTERCTKLGKHLSITRGKVKVTADEFSLSGASVPLLSTHVNNGFGVLPNRYSSKFGKRYLRGVPTFAEPGVQFRSPTPFSAPPLARGPLWADLWRYRSAS